MNKNIQIQQENVLNAYKNASDEQKELLEHLFGREVFKPVDVKERIKTFADAAKAVGIEDPEEWESGYSDVEPDILAYFKLRIITKALNEGWEPKFTVGEYRWFPFFVLYTKDEIDKMDEKTRTRVVLRSNSYAATSGGVAYVGADGVSSDAYSNSGSRLAFKSEELAEYAGKQFTEIYADFCFIPKEF